MAWNLSPDTNVLGYYLCYGYATGQCTNRLNVGNVSSAALGGLKANAPYYFVVVAYDGNGQESPPSNEVTYSVPLASQAPLVFTPASPQAFSTTNLLSVTGGSGTGAVTFTVLSGPGVILDGNKLVVTSGSGVVTIKASKAADANYLGMGATNSVLASAASQTIVFQPVAAQKTTNTVTLSASVSSGLAVSYDVISGKASLSGNHLSFSGAGTVVVAARQTGNTDYLPVSATNTFNVTEVVWPSIVLQTNLLSFTTTYGDTNPNPQTLVLTNLGELGLAYTNAIAYTTEAAGWLTFSPDNGSIAAYGTQVSTVAVDIARMPAGTYYATNIISSPEATNSPVTWVAALTINKADQAEFALVTSERQTYGTTTVLSVTGSSGNGTVTFEVLDGPGVIVDNQLTLTSGTGVVTVRATKAGDNDFNAVSVTNTVTANLAEQGIRFDAIAAQKTTNKVTLAAVASSGLPVSYTISGPAMLDGNQLSFTSAGEVTVAALQAGDANYLPVSSLPQTFTVRDVVWPAITVQTNLLNFMATYGEVNPAAQLLVLGNSGELPLTFTNQISFSSGASNWLALSLDSTSICAYGTQVATAAVNVASLPAGTFYATNTITSAEATNGPITWIVALTVEKADQSNLVLVTPATQTYGTSSSLDVTGGSGTGAVTVEVIDGPGAVVGNGLSLTSGTGVVTVKATKAGDSNFKVTSVTNTVIATQASQSISLNAIADQTTTNVVVLTAAASSGLPISYSVSGPATLNGNRISFTSAGSVTVTATQVGDANYLAATPAVRTFSVRVLAWPSIVLQTNLLRFTAKCGDKTPTVQALVLTNTGELPLTYTSTITYSQGGSNWLTLDSYSGSIAAFGTSISTATVNVRKLPAGTYFATNTIVSPESTNGPVVCLVKLTVNKANQAPLALAVPATQVCGTTNTLSAVGGSGTGDVVYQLVDGPATIVDSNKLVLVSGSGSVRVKAIKSEDAFYNAAETEAVIMAQPARVAQKLGVKARQTARGQTVQLNFQGVMGGAYRIEGSNDLQTWETLWSATCPADGAINLDVADMANHSMRFYRLVQD